MLNKSGNTTVYKKQNKFRLSKNSNVIRKKPKTYRFNESPINARKKRFNIDTNLERNHIFFCLRSNTSSIITNRTRNGIFLSLYEYEKRNIQYYSI